MLVIFCVSLWTGSIRIIKVSKLIRLMRWVPSNVNTFHLVDIAIFIIVSKVATMYQMINTLLREFSGLNALLGMSEVVLARSYYILTTMFQSR